MSRSLRRIEYVLRLLCVAPLFFNHPAQAASPPAVTAAWNHTVVVDSQGAVWT